LGDHLEFVASFQCTVLPVPIAVTRSKPIIGLPEWRRHSLWGWQSTSTLGLVSKPGQPSAFTWSIEPNAATADHSVTLSLALSEVPTESLTLITTVNGNPETDRIVSSSAPFQLVFDSDAIVQNSPLNGLVIVEFRLVDANGQPVDTSLTLTNFVATQR
jgi:hypothetical protein